MTARQYAFWDAVSVQLPATWGPPIVTVAESLFDPSVRVTVQVSLAAHIDVPWDDLTSTGWTPADLGASIGQQLRDALLARMESARDEVTP